MDPLSLTIVASGLGAGLTAAGWAALKAWNNWLEFKKLELAQSLGGDPRLPPAGGRIELADLKERIRKLEAIAAGIDL